MVYFFDAGSLDTRSSSAASRQYTEHARDRLNLANTLHLLPSIRSSIIVPRTRMPLPPTSQVRGLRTAVERCGRAGILDSAGIHLLSRTVVIVIAEPIFYCIYRYGMMMGDVVLTYEQHVFKETWHAVTGSHVEHRYLNAMPLRRSGEAVCMNPEQPEPLSMNPLNHLTV